MSNASQHVIPPYGVAIQSAISEGKLPEMKALLAKRDPARNEPKDLHNAYEQLAQEVARLERR
ncbi:DUF1843 domain-containing protein [Pseudomonas protegens]|jgi:hypothetical protein|uniref:DUF1843 domain-containing protein n=2 Tax=Pseudomonas protegens TaxID=380021 RepID=Q4KES1_PSEF5|nr:DUF1843 domain-containing protein [Pseudomonas protegens]AAY91429.1 conserved hypothetical protein [Pseudomonas protegens Pf-5]ASE24318.2 DUF1843 domain-containing protein [Pseudomonas protegens]QEZ52036.1 DUF1843 domain-containing protein [Pseudomonas protegens]QEZ55897.1 DUF1843 domain-containing protein [Pseudomonas protegens]QEZ63296.1 DUF1843 domain-containing protein [Pseudomonas protegens]